MIRFIHLGTGGTHTRQVSAEIQKINRIRTCRLSNTLNTHGTHTVVFSNDASKVLTYEILERILNQSEISLVVGDSNGVPEKAIKEADEVYALTSVPTTHQLQALVLAEALSASIILLSHNAKTSAS